MEYFIVDAFSKNLFSGNPAGVCLLDKSYDDLFLQKIATENNMAETAFIAEQDNGYSLRWFTPEVEVDLCGHATLAAGFVVTEFINKTADAVKFYTQSGELNVTKKGYLFEMDFPSRPPRKIEITDLMRKSINADILEAHISRDLLLLVNDEDQVRSLEPDIALIKKIPDILGVIITARGISYDFVSRFFAPNVDIAAPEDHVTGSAHCTLIPFWSERLGKNELSAYQLSKRGGELFCRNCGDRVKISGHAVLYLNGNIFV